MSGWNFPGSRWWKFDFHAHTPASDDFMKGCPEDGKAKVSPEHWLKRFMETGIDCVAITDHNSGAWINKLKDRLTKLKQENPDWFRPLFLFPGVEISVNGGIHILAIFDPGRGTRNIDTLLGAVGYQGTRGMSDGVTNESVTKVVDIITGQGGIAIPAHVDKESGLFHEEDGQTLKQVLNNKYLYEMELCDSEYQKPGSYIQKKLQWTEVRGSDTHSFRSGNFGKFTWVKMEKPSIEGLRLALIDGVSSVNRNMSIDPNRHAEFIIEAMGVEKAQYMGKPKPLVCEFSPFLNTVIGGRGSGKSTLLEFMRLVMQRKHEIPESLQDDSDKYFRTDTEGLLTEGTGLHLEYRKGATSYRLNWATEPNEASIQEWDADKEIWCDCEGEIKSLFPVRIYSQKQIFELAKNPQGLLSIIDESPEIDRDTYESRRQSIVHKCKQIGQHRGQLYRRISEESKIKGQLGEINRQIQQIEKHGHKETLRVYRQRGQQLSEISRIERYWQEILDAIDGFNEEQAFEINQDVFKEHTEILNDLEGRHRQWQKKYTEVQKRLDELREDLERWRETKYSLSWMQRLRTDQQKYEQLRAQFEQEGIDPQQYPTLLQNRATIEKQLQEIDTNKEQLDKLDTDMWDIRKMVRELRESLTVKRREFLRIMSRGREGVTVEVNQFAEPWSSVEENIRALIQAGDRFGKDFEELENIYEKEKGIGVREHLLKLIDDDEVSARDQRFRNHLRGLPIESRIDLWLWFPEDLLTVKYGRGGKAITQGSPGEKSAALLTFILSYGDEPLLLDQPEDDLDNELIYNLIVQNLKQSKPNRQIIIVTHNPNIVVNGDAEMVHSLTVVRGQTQVKSGSLQTKETREQICNIMEGGQQALEQRYKRIHLE